MIVDVRLDELLPEPDHVTRQCRWIAGAAGRRVGRPARGEADRPAGDRRPQCRRFLPVLLAGKGFGQLHDRPFLDVLPVPLLSSEEPSSVVFGGALQAWRLSGGAEPPKLGRRGAADVVGARLGEGRDGLPAHRRSATAPS